MASSATKAIGDFQKWLVAGYGAVISLAIPKASDLAAVVGQAPLLWALSLLVLSLVLAVPAMLIGSVLTASAGVKDAEKDVAKIVAEADRPIDMRAFHDGLERALWLPARLGAQWSRRRLERGDWTAPARFQAKLSQAQSLLVITQLLLGVIAVIVAVSGTAYHL